MTEHGTQFKEGTRYVAVWNPKSKEYVLIDKEVGAILGTVEVIEHDGTKYSSTK